MQKKTLSFMILFAFSTFSLVQGMSELNEQLLYQAFSGDAVNLEKTLSQGASVNIKDQHRWTPIYWSIIKKDEKICRILLNNNANLTIKDSTNQFPIDYTVDLNNPSLTKLLLEYGSPVITKKNKKVTR